MMNRYAKIVLVIMGWLVVYVIILVVVTPIIVAFQDPVIQDVPLEFAIPAFIMGVSITVPLIYGALFLLTPLVMATLEVFDPEHQ